MSHSKFSSELAFENVHLQHVSESSTVGASGNSRSRRKFSKVRPQKILLRKITLKLTFENFLTFENSHLPRGYCAATHGAVFSNISSLLNLLCTITLELTFENFYLPEYYISARFTKKLTLELTFENFQRSRVFDVGRHAHRSQQILVVILELFS